jgi:hypothetical protein
MKTKYLFKGILLLLITLFTACSEETYKLGGSEVALPQDLRITAVDSDNDVIISFDPLTIIDGENVLGVLFMCPEAGINFTVKDPAITTLNKKVYTSGEYTLYVAAITRAGTGTPREVPFTVIKNLLLETLSLDVLPQLVTMDNEEFYNGELYIEQNSIITLAGDLADDDVIVNLDFFERESTTTVKFVGTSGVYALYYNPVRKNVIIEPTTAIAKPNYFVLTGVGIGYPTTVSSEAIIAAYGEGDGRYTTSWDPGKNIRSRVVMRSVGTDTYQATICINEGAAFKPFSNTGWGDDIYPAENCTFTGSPILKESGDWSPNENSDKNAYYRITLNAATSAVNIKKVSATGEVLPDDVTDDPGVGGGIDPNVPIESDKIDLTLSTYSQIKGEAYRSLYYTLEKDAEYTLAGDLADMNIVFNVDFFERVSATKVKFLGENGNYRLHYNPIRRYVLTGVDSPRYPNHLVGVGIGLTYPTKIPAATIGTYYPGKDWYTTEWNTDDVMRFILFRQIAGNQFQATVFIAPDWSSFKLFENTTNWWDGGKNFSTFTFSGVPVLQSTGGGDDNWGAAPALAEGQAYRITVDLETNSANITTITLP